MNKDQLPVRYVSVYLGDYAKDGSMKMPTVVEGGDYCAETDMGKEIVAATAEGDKALDIVVLELRPVAVIRRKTEVELVK